MTNRRRLIQLALTAMLVPAAWLASNAVAQAQAFQRFTPLLIDLPGWQGGKPDGVAMEIPGSSMITATREYQRGDARVNAQILIGAAAQGAAAAATTGIKVETSEARMSTSTMDGLTVTRTYTFKDKAGAVMVILGPSAVFMFTFNGVAEDEGLKLAQQFNWKAMQAAIPK
jgi:hypothetical protein